MKSKKKKSGVFTTILLIIIFLAGLSLVLYPTVANYWNSLHQSRAISSYVESLANLDEAAYDEMWQSAWAYNEAVANKPNQFAVTDAEAARYESLLNIGGSGVMGYIDIPKIEVSLPIYHGTSAAVLQIAVGHLDWTSLPVGGEGSHAALSGHRGLPSAKLFTNLDRLEEGDTFLLNILDEVLTYEVDQILIVKPDDVKDLTVEKGKDYVTLITCTPYGVNSHRMLVRGHRIETAEEVKTIRVVSEAVQIEPIIVAPCLASPLLFVLLLLLLFGRGGKKKRK